MLSSSAAVSRACPPQTIFERAATRCTYLNEGRRWAGWPVASLWAASPSSPTITTSSRRTLRTIELIDRLGLGDQLEWHRGTMAVLHRGDVLPLDSPLDLLRLRPLSFGSRLRTGMAMSVQLLRRDLHALDERSAAQEARRWFGRDGYEMLWRPLLLSKFGPDLAERVTAAWLLARIRQRASARRARGDRLGYLRGSIGRLAEAYAVAVRESGAEITTSARVTSLASEGGAWVVGHVGPAGALRLRATVVVAALAGPVLSQLVALPAAYRSMIDAIPYRGAVCVVLELSRPLGTRYWTNVTDAADGEGLGCVAIIEHTSLVPPSRYGGRSIVYLAHYTDETDRAWSATAEELISAAGSSLRGIQPGFEPSWVNGVHVARDLHAQPVPLVGGPMPRLPIETGLDGLFNASLAHIYPDDRGVSQALRLGARVARAADAVLAGPRP